MKTFKNYSLENINKIANYILTHFPQKIVLLKGNLGVGKTTLIKEFCKILGSYDETSSPTYSIVNEYIINQGKKIFHFDLYRMKTLEEILDFGFEEYIYSGNYCFIEWPEFIENWIEEDKIVIKIENNNNFRIMTIT